MPHSSAMVGRALIVSLCAASSASIACGRTTNEVKRSELPAPASSPAPMLAPQVPLPGAGQAGSAADANANVASEPEDSSTSLAAVQLSAAGKHACVTLVDGSVRCWGSVVTTEFGLDVPSGIAPPVAIPHWANLASVWVGPSTVCALGRDGKVSILGDLDVGPARRSLAARPLPTLQDVTSLAAGQSHWCALNVRGEIWCWGSNFAGEVGGGAPSGTQIVARENEVYAGPAKRARFTLTPVRVPDLDSARQIAAGDSFACAISTSGAVECWGWNKEYELGDRVLPGGPKPRRVQGVSNATKLALGLQHVCARTGEGNVLCWGDNSKAQLGEASSGPRESPAAVPNLHGVADIAAGGFHTCALDANGVVSCWGDGKPIPKAIPGLDRPVALAAGADFSCALSRTGKVSCWGSGRDGQLGCGDMCASSDTPRTIVW